MTPDVKDLDSLAENKEKTLDPNLAKFIDFLQTDRGEKMFERVVALFGSHTHRSACFSLVESLLKYAVVGGVIFVVYLLSSAERFDGSIGVLLGTLVGYLFAKQKP